MSYKRIILIALLALASLGIGAAAAVLGGLCLVCVGLARRALRHGKPTENAALPAPRTGRELQRVRPATPGQEKTGPQVIIRRYHQ